MTAVPPTPLSPPTRVVMYGTVDGSGHFTPTDPGSRAIWEQIATATPAASDRDSQIVSARWAFTAPPRSDHFQYEGWACPRRKGR